MNPESSDPTVLLAAPAPSGEKLRSTLPAPSALAATMTSAGGLSRSRRTSLMANLAGPGDGALPDRYEEGRVLGESGMGVVIQAEDRDLARPVAVKKLRSVSRRPENVDRFLREAQVTAQLEHPGVLPVHDLGVDDKGDFFYVMRLVRGEVTLRHVIERLRAGDAAAHREFTFERRVEVVQQSARILHYAHTKGVVHRDVKPENIMLGAFGEVYLVDWGLAKVVGAPAEEGPAGGPVELSGGSATQAGALIGTPRYMSPEQSKGEPATPLSDVFALSAVLYELLSLEHYLGEREAPSADTHVHAKNGRAPAPLAAICERGLAKEPGERFPSAHALERALQGWIEGE